VAECVCAGLRERASCKAMRRGAEEGRDLDHECRHLFWVSFDTIRSLCHYIVE